jgi:fumarate reductase iron-sulfur subunit
MMSENSQSGRILKISILRYNPQIKEDVPRVETFEIEEAPGMTLFIALNEIRQHQENSLKFDFVCRAGICGSCGMIINGRPGLACRALTTKMDAEISLAPLPVFELIGDLSVFSGKWMSEMTNRLETWIHEEKAKETNINALEESMDPDLSDEIYELDRCIECGCCVAGCGTILMRNDFVGAVGLNKIARYRLDPRDKRNDEDYYNLIGDENGVFGCMSLMGCEDVCPKELPLQSKIAYLRRKMVQMKDS